MAKLTEIDGMDEGTVERLKTLKITSTQSLLEKGASPEGRQMISGDAAVPPLTLLEWLYRADLERISGVALPYADLLVAAGVTTVPDLGYRSAAELYAQVSAVNQEQAIVKRTPSLAQVADWIEQARQLPVALSFPPNEAF